ncbi:hypothetical protein PR202_gb16352 [Eleusine coracana subsp. coracana]|uniref:AAA+ ATPase domain-containing protein n=1 Tax=Eleusine coracana subsp. coracana TaxID=191504 RepID=A0AAV5F052_ELECO|nr:hypothetical protein PR202_gb16352 [Eleusine coracana subsp. coracana]
MMTQPTGLPATTTGCRRAESATVKPRYWSGCDDDGDDVNTAAVSFPSAVGDWGMAMRVRLGVRVKQVDGEVGERQRLGRLGERGEPLLVGSGIREGCRIIMDIVIGAARWVVGTALSRVTDGLLESWVASSGLGPNVRALKLELLYAQGILNNARGRDVHNPALGQLLLELRHQAYNADDVLDELEYFRIQDELDGTYETVDDDRGLVNGLVLNFHHTARAVASKLNLPSCCSCAAMCQHHKTPKLKFDRVEISKRMAEIVEKLKPVCAVVSTILDTELLGMIASNSITTQQGMGSNLNQTRNTTPQITEPKLYGRGKLKKDIVDGITHGRYSVNDLTVISIDGPGGLGKTTLTQHIFQAVKSHFQVPIWICVSQNNFNANRLAQEIVKKIPREDNEKESTGSDEELMERRLQSKRLLLVLDDIWKCEEDEWKKLVAPFKKGGTNAYECLTIQVSNARSTQIPASIRHMSIIVEDADVQDKLTFEALKKDLYALGENNAQFQLSVEYLAFRTCGATGMEMTHLTSYFPKLSMLELWDCKKRAGGEDETEAGLDGLLLLPRQLKELSVIRCPELRICSSSLQRDQSETLQIVTSLRELRIKRCDRLQLVALGLSGLSNLRKLEIAYDSLYLPKGHLPSSLTELIICYCPAIRSLPKGTLPNSLKILEIRGCSAFRSLPRDSLPSSLTELTIYNCPAIRSLHKESLTSSIQTLDVRFSRNEKLRMQCRKLKGTIPIVMVDL